MKNNYLLLLVFALIGNVSAYAQEPKYQVSGKLSEMNSDSLILVYVNSRAGYAEPIDTIVMKDGVFGFDLPFPSPATIVIEEMPAPKTMGREEGLSISLVVVPGEQAVIVGTPNSYSISGSSFYKSYNAVKDIIISFDMRLKTLMREREAALVMSETETDSVADLYEQKRRLIMNEMSDSAMVYIRKHPNEESSAVLITCIRPEDRARAVAFLSEPIRKGRMAEYYGAFVSDEEVQKELDKNLQTVQPGSMAPDFTLTDIGGKRFTLSAMRGKHVVLDFWGSWCGWCIKGFPDMKKSYDRHKDKVEFVGIDSNDMEQVWRKAVAEHQLPWIQVRNSGVPEDLSVRYAVKGYPSKFIIDPEGRIIKIVTGEDAEFYTFLDELLK